MRTHIGRLFLAAGTAATLIAMPLASRAAELSTPTIIVSEIAWAGSSMSTVDEWLELANLTGDAIDLSGWTVTGAASSNGSLTIPVGKSIPPHSTFLISNYDELNAKSSLARVPDFVTASVSLSNASLALDLVDANGTVRDSAGSGGAPLAGRVGGGDEPSGTGPASMVRLAPVADGAIATSWVTATGSDGFDIEATNLGTPGAVESWFVPVPTVDAAPVVETEIPPALVSPPPFEEGPGVVVATEEIASAEMADTSSTLVPPPDWQEGSSSATASEENSGVVVEETLTNEETIATVETVEPTIEMIPTIDEPTEPDAEEPIVMADIVPDLSSAVSTEGEAEAKVETTVEIPVEESLSSTEEIAAPMTTPVPPLNEGGETLEGTSAVPTTSEAAIEPVETPIIEPAIETLAIGPVETAIVESTETTPIEMVSISPTTVAASMPLSSDASSEAKDGFPLGTLLINEFVSDATIEWIEVLNPFNNVIDLSGWTVRDATQKETALPDQLLGLGQFAVVTNPSGKLNNDGDTIQLVDPSGSVVDEVVYGTDGEAVPKKPDALARDASGSWVVTGVLTPGAENAFEAVEVNSSQEAAVAAPNGTDETDTTHGSNMTAASEIVSTPADEPIVAEPSSVTPGPTTLRLFEIYPNATGDDAAEEFVAIENFGTVAVDLQGWSIADAAGKTFSPSDPTPIEPGASLSLFRETTKIVLNNTSDAVTLSAPNGTLIDSISYDSPPIGSVLRLQNSEWVWSGNVEGSKPGAISAGVVATPSAPVAPASSRGGGVSRARVSGTVLVAPGVLGTQIFYVDDGDGGIQVYKNDADFPDLKEGDVVTVTGTVTESRGEERLKVGKTDSITVVESTEPEAAETMAIADIAENDHGKLIRVAGIVLVRSGSHATLEDHGARINVRVADGTGIDATVFANGTSVEVTGILVAASGTLTLLPRSPDDVTVTPVETTTVAATTIAPGKSAQATSDRTAAVLITLGTLLSIALFAGRKLIPSWNLYAKTRALRLAASAAR